MLRLGDCLFLGPLKEVVQRTSGSYGDFWLARASVIRRERYVTCALEEEREDIARHEDLGQISFFYHGILLAANEQDDPSERHVYCCGEKSGGDEEQDRLLDEGS